MKGWQKEIIIMIIDLLKIVGEFRNVAVVEDDAAQAVGHSYTAEAYGSICVDFCDDVLEGMEGVGAQHEVVLHEEKV